MGRCDAERRPNGHQIANVPQHRFIGRAQPVPARLRAVPRIDTPLELIASGQQPAIDGSQLLQERSEPLPEVLRRNPGAGKGFIVDEAQQCRCDLDTRAAHGAGRARPVILTQVGVLRVLADKPSHKRAARHHPLPAAADQVECLPDQSGAQTSTAQCRRHLGMIEPQGRADAAVTDERQPAVEFKLEARDRAVVPQAFRHKD